MYLSWVQFYRTKIWVWSSEWAWSSSEIGVSVYVLRPYWFRGNTVVHSEMLGPWQPQHRSPAFMPLGIKANVCGLYFVQLPSVSGKLGLSTWFCDLPDCLGPKYTAIPREHRHRIQTHNTTRRKPVLYQLNHRSPENSWHINVIGSWAVGSLSSPWVGFSEFNI